MPKPTFLRLSDTKRQKFIAAAWKEFSTYNYEKASLSRLVGDLGIAKGSIYQYFENKKDLYLYLIEHANQQKQQYLKEKITSPPENFLDWFEHIDAVGLQFESEYPHISKFLYNVSQERHANDLGNLRLLILRQSTAYFEKLIKAEQSKGNVQRDIPADLLAFLLSQWSDGIQDFIQINPSQSPKRQQLTKKLLEIIKFGVLAQAN